MQMSTDARFQVLQGKCVGGSTVVNNAVCFDIPPRTRGSLERPRRARRGPRRERLLESFVWLRSGCRSSTRAQRHLRRRGSKMAEGIKKLRLDGAGGVVDANIKDCLGSGYCNMGCAYGKKLSALDNILPAPSASSPTACGSSASASRRGSRRRAEGRPGSSAVSRTGASCASPPTRWWSRAAPRLEPAAERAGSAADGSAPGLSFNVGAPLTADFEQELTPTTGFRSPYRTARGRGPADLRVLVQPGRGPGPADAGLVLGPLRKHAPLLHLSCIGVVVGSQSNGRVKPGFRGSGMKLTYEPTPADLKLMIKGNKLAAGSTSRAAPCG